MLAVAILGGCVLLAGAAFVGWRLWRAQPRAQVVESDERPAIPEPRSIPDFPDRQLLLPRFAGPPEPEPFVGPPEPPPPPQPVFFGPPEPSPEWLANHKVRQAIDRGVAFLKGRIDKPVREPYFGVGATALAGLTLLECGVPPDDPAVQKAATLVRGITGKIMGQSATPIMAVYEYAVAVWFLDRLGKEADRPLIRSLALRLIAGQTVNGGWNYGAVPALTDKAEKELAELLKSKPDAAAPAAKDALLKNVAALRFRSGDKVTFQAAMRDDNSLTQFAILALWVARKHGVPVERPLALVEARMRACQFDDGSWGYQSPDGYKSVWRDSMTCAGLTGLAVARGVRPRDETEAKPVRDDAVDRGVRYIRQRLGKDRKAQAKLPNPPPDVATFKGKLIGADSAGDLYFLWSVERMAMVYEWPTIGDIDWYTWGCELILPAQQADGSWVDVFPKVPDTCFALLFLKRANVVKDLTVELKSKPIEIRTKD